MVQMTYYDLTNMTNRSGNQLVNLIQYTSEQTHFMAGYVLYVTLFLIIFLALKMKGATTPAAAAATCFAMFVVTILFYPLHIVSGYLLAISIVLLPISVFILFLEGNGSAY